MKLSFCLFNYFPFGGLERDFIRIAKECVRRGHRVQVYTMRWDGERDPALPVKIIPTRGWQNHTRCKNFVAQLKKELQQEPADLVIGFNKMPGLDVYYAADLCIKTKVEAKYGFCYRLLPRFRHLIGYEKAVFAKNNKTAILLIAPQQQAKFIFYYQTEVARFHLLPPGVAKDRVAPTHSAEIRAKTREQFHLTNHDFLLLMVGSGFKIKGLNRTLKAIAALPEAIKKRVTLFVAGKAHAEPFKQQARQLGILSQIHFLGGRDDVLSLMLAADLLIHPAYYENTGTVLLEALVAGLPVLTTDVCGYADYVKQATAGVVLASPFIQEKLNRALQEIVSMDLSTWRHNALNFAKNADIYSMPERAVDVIESLENVNHRS